MYNCRYLTFLQTFGLAFSIYGIILKIFWIFLSYFRPFKFSNFSINIDETFFAVLKIQCFLKVVIKAIQKY